MGSVNDHIPKRLKFALETQLSSIFNEHYDRKMFDRYGIFLNAECVKIGTNVRFLPGSVIGFKGFSWGFHEDQSPEEMFHKGGVIIGDNVEIGANCTIPRATLSDCNTIIGNYVKLDSAVHIGHNSVIGEKCIFAAGAVTGGGVRIGERSWCGLNATIMEGVSIGKNNVIGMGAVIRHNTKDNAVMYGNDQFLRYR